MPMVLTVPTVPMVTMMTIVTMALTIVMLLWWLGHGKCNSVVIGKHLAYILHIMTTLY